MNSSAGVRSYPAAEGVLHSGRMVFSSVFLTGSGCLGSVVVKLILWFFQSMFGFYFSSQGWPRMTSWCGRDTTQRSIFSSCFFNHRYAVRAALLQAPVVPFANTTGILDTSERAKENLSAACLETKFPMALLSIRILIGMWLRVPLKVMGFLVNKLLILSVSAAGGSISLLGQESKRRLGVTGLRWLIFRCAWEALKIILFLTLQVVL